MISVGKVANSVFAGGAKRKARYSFFAIDCISDRRGIHWDSVALLRTHEYEALAVLRNAIRCRVQYLPRKAYIVTGIVEGFYQLSENGLLAAYSQTFHILENEGFCIKLCDNPNEFEHEAVARVVENTLADQRKSLAWRPAENAVNGRVANLGALADFAGRQAHNRTANDRRVGEVEFMDRAMHRIDFNGSGNVKTGLFEAKRHTSGTSKKIDSNRAQGVLQSSLAQR